MTTVERECRSSWYLDMGQNQGPGSREVRCNLPAGHNGEHADVEIIDGEWFPLVTWPQRKPEPRTWSLPDEPGPEVTAVRCTCHGIRWDRTEGLTAAREALWEAEHHEPGFGWPTWRDLLSNHDRLIDVSGEVA